MPTLSEKQPVARKVHECDLCSEQINIGEKYISQKVKDDEGVYTFSMHEKCHKLTAEMNMNENADEGITDEIFKKCVTKKYDEISSEKIPFRHKLNTVMGFYGIGTV